MRNGYIIVVGKPKVARPHGGPKCRYIHGPTVLKWILKKKIPESMLFGVLQRCTSRHNAYVVVAVMSCGVIVTS
jgi:hypothetical protein